MARRIWEPSLPVPVPVQVEGCRGVQDVFAVADQEVAGGVPAVGAAVDDPAPLQGLMTKVAVTSPSTWVTPAMKPRGVDGEVVDAVAVLVDLTLIAEAVGEGQAIQGRAALEVFDEDVLDDPGVGVGRDPWGQGKGEGA
jgi:hypothetical protein